MSVVLEWLGPLLAIPSACLAVVRSSWGGRWWIAGMTTAAVGAWAMFYTEAWEVLGFVPMAVAWGVATAVDVADKHLPDPLTVLPIPVFYLCQLPWVVALAGGTRYATAVGGMLMTAGVLFVLAFANPSGFGLGDVKLGLATGAALGWFGLGTALAGLAASFILMALTAVILLTARRIGRDSELPFGPFMILGVLVGPAVTSVIRSLQ